MGIKAGVAAENERREDGVTPRCVRGARLLQGRWTSGFFRILFPAILYKILAHIPDEILGFSNGGDSLMLVHPLRAGVISGQGQGQTIIEFFQEHLQIARACRNIFLRIIGVNNLQIVQPFPALIASVPERPWEKWRRN